MKMSDDAQLPDEVDESERGAWEAYLSLGFEPDGDSFRDAYAGEYARQGDYAEQFADDVLDVPVWLAGYIDYQLMERDWELNGDISTVQEGYGAIYVFRNN
jgi:antirestriction protein